MLTRTADNWWATLVRGLAALAFGILMFALAGLNLHYVVVWFGVYAIVDGLFALAFAAAEWGNTPLLGTMVLEGLVSIAAGIIVLVWPSIPQTAVRVIIAIWAIVIGVLDWIAIAGVRPHMASTVLLALSGLAAIILGIVFFAMPGASVLTLMYILAVFGIVFGVLEIALSFALRTGAPGPAHEPAM